MFDICTINDVIGGFIQFYWRNHSIIIEALEGMDKGATVNKNR